MVQSILVNDKFNAFLLINFDVNIGLMLSIQNINN